MRKKIKKNKFNFYKLFKNKKVLVTGHTGFKGSWLSIWLHLLGAKVIGISSDVPSDPCNFYASQLGKVVVDRRIDIRDADSVRDLVQQAQPNFVFHLAAQPLERRLEVASKVALLLRHVLHHRVHHQVIDPFGRDRR